MRRAFHGQDDMNKIRVEAKVTQDFSGNSSSAFDTVSDAGARPMKEVVLLTGARTLEAPTLYSALTLESLFSPLHA